MEILLPPILIEKDSIVLVRDDPGKVDLINRW